MNFNQFKNKLIEHSIYSEVKAQFRSYGNLIQETVDGKILINGTLTDHDSINSARNEIKNRNLAESMEQQVALEKYDSLNDSKLASIIKEHYDVKVTNSLIESYLKLSSSKIYTTDPVVSRIRGLNRFDSLIENKIDFILDDGTVIAIEEETQTHINSLLHTHLDVVDYMKESYENFFHVIKHLNGERY